LKRVGSGVQADAVGGLAIGGELALKGLPFFSEDEPAALDNAVDRVCGAI